MLTIRYKIRGGCLGMLLKRTDHGAQYPWWFDPNPKAELPPKSDPQTMLPFYFFWTNGGMGCETAMWDKTWFNKEDIEINGIVYPFTEWSSWLPEHDCNTLTRMGYEEDVSTRCLDHLLKTVTSPKMFSS